MQEDPRVFMTTVVTKITIFALVTKVTSGAKVALPTKDSPIPVDTNLTIAQWLLSVVYRGGIGEFTPPEIPKALQNRAKLNSIVKTVKNF